MPMLNAILFGSGVCLMVIGGMSLVTWMVVKRFRVGAPDLLVGALVVLMLGMVVLSAHIYMSISM